MTNPDASQPIAADPAPLPLVSYILVNWNTEDSLPAALDSVMAQTYGMREIVLVNNGSAAFDAAMLGPYGPLILIENERNEGFCRANNQGISASSGDVVVLLNCDARLHPAFTANALRILAANRRIGTVVPKLLVDEGQDMARLGDAAASGQRIDSTGHVLYTDRGAGNRGKGQRDQGQFDCGGFVFGGTAAAVAYRREMLLQLAQRLLPWRGAAGRLEVFDESFFAYYEDVDLDWRANLAGWRAYYDPRCVALHIGHGSGGRKSRRLRTIAEKNRYLMRTKNDTSASTLRSLGPLLIYEMWHFAWLLISPHLWAGYALLAWHWPRAVLHRLRAGPLRRRARVQIEPLLTQRGLQDPPLPAPPSPAVETAAAGSGATFPLVSVIVLNYNGLNMTRACLMALKAQTYTPLEIIVVDNGSATDEAELLQMELQDEPPGISVRLLRLAENHGFAGGVNWGASIATGDFIVLLNNDALPASDCIKRLVYAQRRSGAAAVSGRLVNVHDLKLMPAALAALELEASDDEMLWEVPEVLQPAFEEAARNNWFSIWGYAVREPARSLESDEAVPPADAPPPLADCFYPSGGLCLLSVAVLKEIGHLPCIFPSLLFAYHEDVYLGYALRSRGLEIVKEPRAAAAHIKGATSRSLGSFRLGYLTDRNKSIVRLLFMPGSILLRMALPRILIHIGALFIGLLRHPLTAVGRLAAIGWIAMHLPSLLRLRRRTQQQIRVPARQWLSRLSGQVRGGPSPANTLSLLWCELAGIPCRELEQREQTHL